MTSRCKKTVLNAKRQLRDLQHPTLQHLQRIKYWCIWLLLHLEENLTFIIIQNKGTCMCRIQLLGDTLDKKEISKTTQDKNWNYLKFCKQILAFRPECCSVLWAVGRRILGALIVACGLLEIVLGVEMGVGDQVVKIAVVGPIVEDSVPNIWGWGGLRKGANLVADKSHLPISRTRLHNNINNSKHFYDPQDC